MQIIGVDHVNIRVRPKDMEAMGPEPTIVTDLTVKGTCQEHYAAIRIESGTVRSGRNPWGYRRGDRCTES